VPCIDGAAVQAKKLTFPRNRSGAAMYPAFEMQPFWLRA
jgi:hypothetical protein